MKSRVPGQKGISGKRAFSEILKQRVERDETRLLPLTSFLLAVQGQEIFLWKPFWPKNVFHPLASLFLRSSL